MAVGQACLPLLPLQDLHVLLPQCSELIHHLLLEVVLVLPESVVPALPHGCEPDLRVCAAQPCFFCKPFSPSLFFGRSILCWSLPCPCQLPCQLSFQDHWLDQWLLDHCWGWSSLLLISFPPHSSQLLPFLFPSSAQSAQLFGSFFCSSCQDLVSCLLGSWSGEPVWAITAPSRHGASKPLHRT